MKIQNLIDLLSEFDKDAHIFFTINGEKLDYKKIQPEKPFEMIIEDKVEITIAGPEIQLPPEANNEKIPFKTVFTLESAEKQKRLPVTLTLHRGTVQYIHEFIK